MSEGGVSSGGGTRPPDEIRKLAEAATPGPWVVQYDNVDGSYDMPTADDCEFPWRIVQRGRESSGGPGIVNLYEEETSEADAQYIAAMSPDVTLALLAEVERKDEALRYYAEQRNLHRDFWPSHDSYDNENGLPGARARAALGSSTERGEQDA